VADMNLLVVIGTSAAYFYSVLVLFFPQIFPEDARNLFFESSVAVITFLLIGKYLEEKSKNKASSFIKSLFKLKPQYATIYKDGKEIKVKADEVSIGEVVVLREGEKVPVDGVVIEGSCEIDNSIITGESVPIFVQEKDKVNSGAVVSSGYCKVKALTSGKNSSINQILTLLLKAQSEKPKVSKTADKIVYYFVPTIIIIAIFVFNLWYLLTDDLQTALITSTSVLIIACPCALGLATPIAVVSAVGRGAKEGILIKNSNAIETINSIKIVAFDKTGTLTEGKLSVKSIDLDEKYLPYLKGLACKSSHLVSKAICRHLEKVKEVEFESIKIITGKGIIGKIRNQTFFLGSVQLLRENGISIPKNLQTKDTAVFFASGDRYIGKIVLEDKLKPEAVSVVRWLKEKGYKVVIISGDKEETVKHVAHLLKADQFFSEILPTKKAEIVKKLRKKGGVLFVGDGINDAVAMKVADISIAVHKGTDLTKEAGDLILMGDNLKKIKTCISLLKFTNKVIKQNLLWAYFYNIIGIPVAAGVLYPLTGILLKPIHAGIAMSFSSITVVLNAVRIQTKRFI